MTLAEPAPSRIGRAAPTMVAALLPVLALAGLAAAASAQATRAAAADDPDPIVIVLGIAQDAGFPQAGCAKSCCAVAGRDPDARRHVSCLAIVDPVSHERWLIDATPDLREQLRMLDAIEPPRGVPGLAGILLTHAHIGHYTGLMFLGHESMGASAVPVYAMPRMRAFLASNGPWDQLVRLRNVTLREITDGGPVRLNERITVTPFRVPHREEYSEVVGFRITGPRRTVVFIPDVDKWERWDREIEDVIAEADVAYLDGTFFAEGELPGRDMSAIPHPFIAETMRRLAPLPAAERDKVRFIHLNHTNPALDPASDAARAIETAGFRVAREGERTTM